MQRLNAFITFVAREKVYVELLVLFLDAWEVCWTDRQLWLWNVAGGWDIFFELLLQFDLFKYCFLGKALVEITSMV